MCGNYMKPGPGPEVVASLKELAGRGAGSHRIICESGGVSTEYWLDGDEVRSRCLPTASEDAMRSRLAELVPKLENELVGRDVADEGGIEIAIRDASQGGSSAICASLLEKIDTARFRRPPVRHAAGRWSGTRRSARPLPRVWDR